jgi:hypothetical protein
MILDRDPDDPKWVVATVVEMADVRPAGPGAAVVDDTTAAWVASRAGRPAALTPLRGALAWRVDEPGR